MRMKKKKCCCRDKQKQGNHFREKLLPKKASKSQRGMFTVYQTMFIRRYSQPKQRIVNH